MKTHLNDSDERKHYLINKSTLHKAKIKSVYIGTYSTVKTTPQPAHKHNFCEIMLITNGEGTIVNNKNEYFAKKGDIVVYPPQFLHYEMSKKGYNLQSIFFAIKYNKSVITSFNKTDFNPIIHTEDEYEEFYELFRFLTNESKKTSELYLNEILDNACQTIFLKLLNLSSIEITSDAPNESFVFFKNYLDQHYLENFLIKDVCDKFFVNKFYISRLFKDNLGTTPANYVIQKRIEKAKELLKTTDEPIFKISSMVGYNDAYHFSRLFKKEVGVSPKAFRNSH